MRHLSPKILGQTGLLLLISCIAPLSAAQDSIDWSQLPNFDELRSSFADISDFASRCGLYGYPDDDEVESLWTDGDLESASVLALEKLKDCPVDIHGHIRLNVILQELGREDEAALHLEWAYGLMDTIVASGDGNTSETAYVTISIAEEYAILKAFALKKKSQSLLGDRDVFLAEDRDGNEHHIYFFPEAHWKRLAKLFPD